MLIKVGNAWRNVTMKERTETILRGTVGRAVFTWGRRFELPAVKLDGVWLGTEESDIRVKRMVKAFVIAYENAMQTEKGKSPMHFNESDKMPNHTAVVYNKDLHVSGVPLWMRENHKVWVECHMKDGRTYLRRARFKEESREVVEKYLPLCTECKNRDVCKKPCENNTKSEGGVING